MIIGVVRYKSNQQRTFGRLYIDGHLECFTCEDAFHAKKIPGKTRIPAGSYRIEMRYSPKFSPKYKHEMLWLRDVPNFEYVLIHKGNTENDTAGCLLVGLGVNENGIVGSTLAYDLLYPKIEKQINAGKPVWITIMDQDKGG